MRTQETCLSRWAILAALLPIRSIDCQDRRAFAPARLQIRPRRPGYRGRRVRIDINVPKAPAGLSEARHELDAALEMG